MNKVSQSRLDILDVGLASKLRSITNDEVLRLFASKCAEIAFTRCGNGDVRSWKAIEVGNGYAKGVNRRNELDEAYIVASEAADEADEVAFDMHDAFGEGKVSACEYIEAFGAARAACSARDCCDPVAIEAANGAVYESWAALRTPAERGQTLEEVTTLVVSDAEIDQTIIAMLKRVLEGILRGEESIDVLLK
jgi:hypothetical protein